MNFICSTESGFDNPFRPGGDLSREADEIVNMIKSKWSFAFDPILGFLLQTIKKVKAAMFIQRKNNDKINYIKIQIKSIIIFHQQ